ncbi:hypothetical protein ElyMa_000036800 [Elysia marginata]|uniref:Uncharacterized protein n=1 Tax=Elysia marginata TaxID=1093978 RepID=A0AAV4EDA3_9GAST|nr:hypothetical protein ElyMa_000036800 [Elysia marginata]
MPPGKKNYFKQTTNPQHHKEIFTFCVHKTCMHTRKYLLKNAKESRRTDDELDLDGHDGANGIEAVPDDAPEEDGEKHCVVRK